MNSVSRSNSIQESVRDEKDIDLDLSKSDAKQLVVSAGFFPHTSEKKRLGLDIKTYQELVQERKVRKEQAEENIDRLVSIHWH